ncbi:DUF2786 domain-containing protein [Pseudomonas sp. NPDC089734]|uniref:DUF2786 domain-containing protein n=1 Tax=Pseudomonas sp. NPDC089734 TaxID=3364469 RepID=UPI00380D8B32
MEENRILDKIKKCLEMAKSKTSNPNEAEIALRQARKLMDMYSFEMGDILASMACEISIPAGSEGAPPAWRVRLAEVCCLAFGTRLIIRTSIFSASRFILIGCAASPELTGYAYQVLVRQLQKARRDYLDTQKRCKRSTKVARGDAFANAWIDAVHSKIDAFAGVEDNIADAIEAFMKKNHPDLEGFELKRRKLKSRDEIAADAGYKAGKTAQLHQAVSHQPLARLTAGG